MNSIFATNRLVSRGNRGLTMRLPAVVGNGFAKLSVVVDWTRGEICHRGERLCKLSARETALLAYLTRKAGTPVSRDEILAHVWRLDPRRTATRTIDMHISLLRRKLDDDAEVQKILTTVHGVGYMLQRGAISSGKVHPSPDEIGLGPHEVTTGIESLSTL